MAIAIARMLVPFVMLFVVSFVLRAVLRGYLRRRFDPQSYGGSSDQGTSSARVVDGEYRVKDEPEP